LADRLPSARCLVRPHWDRGHAWSLTGTRCRQRSGGPWFALARPSTNRSGSRSPLDSTLSFHRRSCCAGRRMMSLRPSRWRAGRHLRTATRSGGHCFAGHSSTDGIVIDVTPMKTVSVAGDNATIGAGACLGDVYRSLRQHDRTIPAGSCPSVGIAGLTLGGGLGILGRKYGATSDHLLGAQVVLADGRIVDCDDAHERDLSWPLRGAGAGNFGVVTSLVFRTIPASSATNFHLTWAYRHAAAVIEAGDRCRPKSSPHCWQSSRSGGCRASPGSSISRRGRRL
jgi:hypothetical protein